MKTTHLLGRMFHDHGLAQSHLAVASHGHMTVLFYRQYGCSVRFHQFLSHISLRSL